VLHLSYPGFIAGPDKKHGVLGVGTILKRNATPKSERLRHLANVTELIRDARV